jgi:hypothetical protein
MHRTHVGGHPAPNELQEIGPEQSNAAPRIVEQAPRLEPPQRFARTLARHAREAAEIRLDQRQIELARAPAVTQEIGEIEEPSGKSGRHITRRSLEGRFADPAQSRRQGSSDRECGHPVPSENFPQCSRLEGQHLAARCGQRIGGLAFTVDDRDLSNELSGEGEPKDCFTAAGIAGRQLDDARRDQVGMGPRITFEVQHCPGRKPPVQRPIKEEAAIIGGERGDERGRR